MPKRFKLSARAKYLISGSVLIIGSGLSYFFLPKLFHYYVTALCVLASVIVVLWDRISTVFDFSKRKKFVLISALLSVGLLAVQAVNDDYRYYAIAALSLLTAGLTAWSLKEDLHKISWVMALILPTLFTASTNLFYFLLPEKLLVRIVLLTLFGIGMYALLLTENIFTVAAIRTIQLLRAAQALGFVFSLLIAFLLFDTIFSFRLEPWLNALLIFTASVPIILQGVWSSNLEETLTKEIVSYTLVLSWVLGQSAFLISMWPVTIIIASLFLVTILYVGLGIMQQALVGRLFRQTVREYLQVGVVVFLIVLFAARWGG